MGRFGGPDGPENPYEGPTLAIRGGRVIDPWNRRDEIADLFIAGTRFVRGLDEAPRRGNRRDRESDLPGVL